LISKHIDLLAVGALLLAMAVLTQKRQVVLFRFVPVKAIVAPRQPVCLMPEIPSVLFRRS
jgi:hypothetical protein